MLRETENTRCDAAQADAPSARRPGTKAWHENARTNEKALLDSVQQRFGSGTLCLDCLLVLHLQIRFAVHQN
ncbi:hypothetical protein LFL97_00575 [Burkholderia sp. JSH-S8]|nr:hypothetical protein LFL97_00575 [Burkholderia sp. JSH-S8]